ncbi:MAG: MFS transporter [Steroidobacteraceae bacterium]
MQTRMSGTHLVAAIACGLALSVDMIEMAIGTAFSTVFLAPPYEVGTRELSFLLSSVYLGAVIGAPAFGWFSDRRGIRSCLVVALAVLAVTSFVAAFSSTTKELTVFRFLSGLPLGAIPPLLIAYLTAIARPDRRGLLIFWVCGLAALAPPAALMTMRWLLPLQPLGIEGWRWPLAGAGLLALFTGGLFLALPDGERRSSEVTVRASESLRRHRGRLTYISVVYFLFPWAAVGFPLITGPILLLRGFDVSRALLYVTLTTVGPTVASLLTGLFVDRVGRRSLLACCAMLMAAAVLTFALARSALWVTSSLVLFGTAAAVYVTALTLYAAEVFPQEIRSFSTSTAWACNRAAAVLVPIVLLALVETRDSLLSLLPIIAAIVIAVLLIGFGPKGAPMNNV